MAASCCPPDPQQPPAATTSSASTTAAARAFINPPPSRDLRSITPVPQPPHPYYAAQTLPNLSARVPPNPRPQMSKSNDPPQGVLYPVASSGRGFIPKHIRPQLAADQTVTVANPGGFPPRPVVAFPHQLRSFGFSPSDPQFQSLHLMRAPSPHLHPAHLGSAAAAVSPALKGIPVSAQPKGAASPSPGSDSNGLKDLRDRSTDDTLAIVKDRKVRISDGASLYALCRSWLRNGHPEESQLQCVDGAKSLPSPLPVSVADAHFPKKTECAEVEEQKEDEESVQHLSAHDLLQRHIKKAKRVRSRLREERLQRIARYKTRLAALLQQK